MSNKYTTISLTNPRTQLHEGFTDLDYKTRAEIIKRYRNWATRQKRDMEAILAASDNDFKVEQHLGRYRRKQIKELHP